MRRSAAAIGIGFIMSASVAAQDTRINIAAQPLGPALIQLGARTGRNILFTPDVVAGRQSRPVRDARSIEVALEAMLLGSGLDYSVAPDGSVTISARPREDGPILEEIVVTADREAGFGADFVQVGTFRNARLIDVPVTINIVPRDLIEAQAATTLFEALRNTPGVSRSETSGANFDSLLIRGIQVDNRNSYKLNGSLPVINLVGLTIENKERIEVLKGVGALYYGFAPPSGIVNLVTKRADRDVLQVTGSATEHGTVEAAVDAGIRLSDTVGIRFNGVAGIIATGVDNADGERSLGALAVDWQAAPTLKLSLDLEHITKDATELGAVTLLPAGSPLAPPGTANAIQLPPLLPNTVNVGGRSLRTDARGTTILARADLKLTDQFAFTLEGGQSLVVRDRLFAAIRNYDLRPGSPSFGIGELRVTRTRNQRYRNRHLRAEFAGVAATGPIIHNLVLGGSLNERFQNGRASTPVLVPQNYFEPINAQVPAPTDFTESPNLLRDRGLYLFDRAELGPVQLLGGVRYSSYRSRTTSAAGAVTEFAIDKWTPSVGLVVKPLPSLSLYGTYLQGLEEVSPAPNFAANQGEVLPPATSEQFELGLKAEAFAGLVLQIGAFRITRPSAFVDPVDNVYKLAGEARFQGIEASATGEITKEISVYLTGQYLDAEIRSAAQAALVGKTPENTPDWTVSLFGQWRPSGTGLSLGAGLFHLSSRPVNSLNQARIDPVTTLSSSVAYRFEGPTPVTVQLNGDNLANRRYWAGAGGNVLAAGVPRQVRLTVRVDLR